MEVEQVVVIVGAGPSGLAMAASLSVESIPYIILEREDCFGSLWKKSAYDRLHLHLPKQFCNLPHMPFPSSYPTYVPKNKLIEYLDDYASHFNINPRYHRSVEHATYDELNKKWIVKAKNVTTGDIEVYVGRFLVVASGETTDPFIPQVDGLDTFNGQIIHSTKYKNAKPYCDHNNNSKHVLVVGSGNSGMEIALDLANHGAKTSIVIRSPVHVLNREMVYLGLSIIKYFSLGFLDSLMAFLSKLYYGDLSKYGISRPEEGPFIMKLLYGKYPVVDVGTVKKIKAGEIQVLPAITSIRGNDVLFEDGHSHSFDSIIFCTGFKRSTNLWLKYVANPHVIRLESMDMIESGTNKITFYSFSLNEKVGDDYLLNEDGLPKPSFPNHWKGINGLYCVGLSRNGFHGAADDALNIANHIKSLL
ncbi:hypothetical protein ACFE04_017551 [Oxalis oulophora]